MKSTIVSVLERIQEAVKPLERLRCDEWANKYRKIPKGSSPESGNFNTDRTPYIVEPMQSISDPEVETTVCCFASQLGKTEFELNVCGYYAHMDPCQMMYLMPTLDMAQKISKDRLQPTIDCTPVLSNVFYGNKAKSSSTTILSKHFKGGVIHLSGANSPSSLASTPLRGLLADEIDRYSVSAGEEGDPLSLAITRTKNFHNRFIVLVSTPTNEGSSRIDDEYRSSNQKQRYVPCPHCQHMQKLEFKNFKFDKGDHTVEPYFECVSCNGKMYERHKRYMSKNGVWIAENPDVGKRKDGYFLNEFHSEFSTWMSIRNRFIDWHKSLEKLKVFTNTVLAETWKDTQTLNDSELIKKRREHYDICPNDVIVITAGVDTQDDSLHYEIVGWGIDMQSWGLQYGKLRGDPSRPEIWAQLHEILSGHFERPDGVVLNVMKICIDSAGHKTQDVYDFCKKFKGRYFPIVGRAGPTKPIINRGNEQKKQGGIILYTVGVDVCKETFLCSRLKQSDIAYGYCHYPYGRGYDDQYFSELTNVKKEVKKVKGVSVDVFVDKGRVEAVDCRVYAMAAFEILNPNLFKVKSTIEKLKKQKRVSKKPTKKPAESSRRVAKRGKNSKTAKNMRKLRKKRR